MKRRDDEYSPGDEYFPGQEEHLSQVHDLIPPMSDEFRKELRANVLNEARIVACDKVDVDGRYDLGVETAQVVTGNGFLTFADPEGITPERVEETIAFLDKLKARTMRGGRGT